jgi:hypothetical protein
MTLEQSLYADMLDCFLHGTKKEFLAAERRYYRFINRGRKRK